MDKLKEVNVTSLDDLTDKEIQLIYDVRKPKPIPIKPKPVSKPKKMPRKTYPKVPKDDPKYVLVLELVNRLLENMDRPRIQDLTEFIGLTVDRLTYMTS